ncbi:MAG TPA: energy transducer TonB [Longimicrobium sp.]|uniref:energy transducer TonB n=1 Tax=Longimicrobium sp. TaxID=2029185 RepID=UPI002EDB7421
MYELRGVEVAPRPLNAAEMAAALQATYPTALKAAGVSGTVRVSMVVGADGVPREPRVLESADTAFNAPTLAAVQTLRFSPAELNDQPVNVRVELPVVWQAPAPEEAPAPGGSATPGVLELAAAETPPEPVNVRDLMDSLEKTYPTALRNAGTSGLVRVRFVVGTNGTSSGITVLQSTDPAFNEATILSVSRLRWRPARLNGRPVAVWVELPIQWQSHGCFGHDRITGLSACP